jgi:hypothetical protein
MCDLKPIFCEWTPHLVIIQAPTWLRSETEMSPAGERFGAGALLLIRHVPDVGNVDSVQPGGYFHDIWDLQVFLSDSIYFGVV